MKLVTEKAFVVISPVNKGQGYQFCYRVTWIGSPCILWGTNPIGEIIDYATKVTATSAGFQAWGGLAPSLKKVE